MFREDIKQRLKAFAEEGDLRELATLFDVREHNSGRLEDLECQARVIGFISTLTLAKLIERKLLTFEEVVELIYRAT